MKLIKLPYSTAGTLDGIRTHDLLLRRQLLYPTELPRHPFFILRCKDKIQITNNKLQVTNKSQILFSNFHFFRLMKIDY